MSAARSTYTCPRCGGSGAVEMSEGLAAVWAMFQSGPRAISPPEVAQRLGISRTGANTRLVRLMDLGLLERSRLVLPGGGHLYRYRKVLNRPN